MLNLVIRLLTILGKYVGKLTTHVLDTAQGRPAAGMAIELWALDPQSGERTLLKTAHTNADGRTSEPLLAEGALKAGTYELVFAVGDYFALPGLGARAVHHRRCRGSLSRAAAGVTVGLQHV